MKNRNFLFFIITLVIFIVVAAISVPAFVSSNVSVDSYSSLTLSNPGILSPSIRSFTVEEESLMKFKIASVTDGYDLSVELISEDTDLQILDLSEKDLTYSTFKKLKPGNYTLKITSPGKTDKVMGYNYILQISSLNDYYSNKF